MWRNDVFRYKTGKKREVQRFINERDEQMKSVENPMAYHKAMSEMRSYCKYCGHTLIMTSAIDKTLCTYCGRYNYKNSIKGKKLEFIDNYLKAKRKMKDRK